MDTESFKEIFHSALEFIFALPWYGRLGIVLFIFILFGKKKEWGFEAKLMPEDSSEIVGEVEIKKFKKNDPTGVLDLPNDILTKDTLIEILINNKTISKFDFSPEKGNIKIHYPHIQKKEKHLTRKQRKWSKIPFPIERNLKPQNKDEIEVRLSNSPTLKGIFLND
jgi:hypothetical protein